MPGTKGDRGWILAVLTAVLFPAIVLHSTCIAVMGPGTWGSGVQEVAPELREPTATAEEYGREIAQYAAKVDSNDSMIEPAAGVEMLGRIKWVHRSEGRIVYLTDDVTSEARRQRLYIAESGRLRQLALPRDHVVVRPQWAGERVIYERWNPWAVPAPGKLRRYVASWADPSLRPEAALYASTTAQGGWRLVMPGHSLAVSPNGRYAAFLRSGALLAGYYSVHVWRLDAEDAPPILSLREHDGKGTGSFTVRWSEDSKALLIHGRTDGYSRRGSRDGGGPDGIPVNLLYLTADRTVYDLNLGS